MTQAMKVYEEVKDRLGEEIKVSKNGTKRELQDGEWKYTFFFYNGELAKIEAFNHIQLIEVYNR